MSDAHADGDAVGARDRTAADLEWLSLDPDEEVVWVGEPAFETLYGTIATGLALLVVVIGILVLLGVPFAYLRIRNTDYVVTTSSLYVKKGVLSTNVETVDLDRIQNTEYSRSFWGKRFGYGKIAISTAGSSGSEITFDGIPDARAVRDRIAELQPTRSGTGGDGTSGGRSPAADPATADQIDELVAEVRATREAFERIEEHLAASAGDGRATDEWVDDGGRDDADRTGDGPARPTDGDRDNDGNRDNDGDASDSASGFSFDAEENA